MRTPVDEQYRFRFLTEMRCGVGVTDNLAQHLQDLAYTRCTAIIDRGIKQLSQIESINSQLSAISDLQILDGPVGEPDFEYLEDIRASARNHQPSLVIGVGGGSTMDAAKGVAITLTNDGPCDGYQGLDLYTKPGLPCVTIPTLFGSGAEVTPSAVFINRRLNRKGGINGRAIFPFRALVDPKMMVGIDMAVLGATAMDALVHAVESYTARCATSVSQMFSRQAFSTLINALDELGQRPDSLKGLTFLAEGAFLAITALMHSEQGLAGGSSYPLGVYCSVPHGVAGGRCLPHAIAYNASKSHGMWDEFATLTLGWEKGNGDSAHVLAKKIAGYLQLFNVPYLKDWLADADCDLLAREIHAFRGVMDQNPVSLDLDEIREFLTTVLSNEDYLQGK